MSARVALLHTVPDLVPWLEGICREEAPGVAPVHIVDESLLERAKAEGVTPELADAAIHHGLIAQGTGAKAVLITCSSIGPCVEAMREALDIPVFRIDEPMAHAAVRCGPRCALLATVQSTVEPSTRLLQRAAEDEGVTVQVVPHLVRFDPDRGEPRSQLEAEVRRAAESADVVVLAQASMARILGEPVPDAGAPVLTSPRSGLRRLRNVHSAGPSRPDG